MNIRRATTADVPVLARLQQSVQNMHAAALPDRFRSNVAGEEMEQAVLAAMQNPTAYWLVAEDQQPVGYLSAEFRERPKNWCATAQRVCYLSGIAVEPAFRRRGVARALFSELQREVASRQATSMELDVWAFNDHARQFFASLGFRGIMERMTLAADKSAS